MSGGARAAAPRRWLLVVSPRDRRAEAGAPPSRGASRDRGGEPRPARRSWSAAARTPGARRAGQAAALRIRMSTRPTPFGMFAGVALARFGEATDLRIGAGAIRTRTRPDMGWLLAFVAGLEERPRSPRAARDDQSLGLGPRRPALLAERAAVDGVARRSVAIRATGAVAARSRSPAADRVAPARRGARRRPPGRPRRRSTACWPQLWRQTFLLTELRPPFTHPAPPATSPSAWRDRARRRPTRGATRLLEAMAAWDELDTASGRRRIAPCAGSPALPCRATTASTRRSTPRSGSTAAASACGRPARRTGRRAPAPAQPGVRRRGALHDYHDAFVRRYGADREVPLLELLDPDPGSPSAAPGARAGRTPPRAAPRALRDRASTRCGSGGSSVELDEAAIEARGARPRAPRRPRARSTSRCSCSRRRPPRSTPARSTC